jgi:hypothetical protein
MEAIYAELQFEPLLQRMKRIAALTYLRLSTDSISIRINPALDLTTYDNPTIPRTTTSGSAITRVVGSIKTLILSSGGILSTTEAETPDNRYYIDISSQDSQDVQYTIDQEYTTGVATSGKNSAISININLQNTEQEVITVRLPDFTSTLYLQLSAIIIAVRHAVENGIQRIAIKTTAFALLTRLLQTSESNLWTSHHITPR